MALERRKFLAGGFFASIASAVGFKKEFTAAPPLENKLTYDGFELTWSGWKSHYSADWICGQWFAVGSLHVPYVVRVGMIPARQLREIRLYAATPGKAGYYNRGDMLDISLQEGQRLIYENTPEGIRDYEKQRAYHRIVYLIAKAQEYCHSPGDFHDGSDYDFSYALQRSLKA